MTDPSGDPREQQARVGMFRKKPVTIEAWRAVEDAVFPHGAEIRRLLSPTGSAPPQWQVFDVLHLTWVNFDLGDWIIKGVKGEFYPCKPDIFEATYEPVEAGAAALRHQIAPSVSVEEARSAIWAAIDAAVAGTVIPGSDFVAICKAIDALIEAVSAEALQRQQEEIAKLRDEKTICFRLMGERMQEFNAERERVADLEAHLAEALQRPSGEILPCPICQVWTGYPLEVIAHITERHVRPSGATCQTCQHFLGLECTSPNNPIMCGLTVTPQFGCILHEPLPPVPAPSGEKK